MEVPSGVRRATRDALHHAFSVNGALPGCLDKRWLSGGERVCLEGHDCRSKEKLKVEGISISYNGGIHTGCVMRRTTQ